MPRLRAIVPDLLVFAGLCLIAAGFGWYSLGAAAIVFGAGLILAVRYGSH